MIQMVKKYVQIGGLNFQFEVIPSFKGIQDLISRFKIVDPTNAKLPTIVVRSNTTRVIRLSDDNRTLSISGRDIDDLTDSYNLIGILQAVFRFVAIHSAAKGVYLVHGSSSVVGNGAICFGDDGASTAKTLSSVELSLASRTYLGDEFCFLDIKSGEVSSYPFIPIHLRPIVEKHLVEFHHLTVPRSICQQTPAGSFVEPRIMFEVKDHMRLKAVAFVHFTKNQNSIASLVGGDKIGALTNWLAAHPIKLLYPELDRMQFSKRRDSTRAVGYPPQVLKRAVTELCIMHAAPAIAKWLPCYRLFVQQPCDILPLILSALSS